jgi:hypothetical protein
MTLIPIVGSFPGSLISEYESDTRCHSEPAPGQRGMRWAIFSNLSKHPKNKSPKIGVGSGIEVYDVECPYHQAFGPN